MTEQIVKWSGEFGKEYTKRNKMTIEDMEYMYKKRYGINRKQMNEEFLSKLDKDVRVLEVGCNIGNQLALLKEMGFENLYGMEVSDYAFEIAKRRTETQGISFIKGNAFELPFKAGFFDMVFTSGVLIHISPDDIKNAVSEIYRCSNKYIWGLEYYAASYQKVVYKGHKNLLWKTDFARIYMDNFPDLKLVKEKKYVYRDDKHLTDEMFLLEK
jgi:pseudaminic acid biosynthesis-associated methylase